MFSSHRCHRVRCEGYYQADTAVEIRSHFEAYKGVTVRWADLVSSRSTQVGNITVRAAAGLGSRNAGCSRGSRDAYCHDVFKWTFCDILFVPVQGASQNIRFHILAALRLLPHRLAGMLRAITPPTPRCVHRGSRHTMLYPGRVGYTAHRAGHTRQERAWRSHRKHCPSGLLTSEEKGISFSREAQGTTWCTDGKRRRQRRCDHWGSKPSFRGPCLP